MHHHRFQFGKLIVQRFCLPGCGFCFAPSDQFGVSKKIQASPCSHPVCCRIQLARPHIARSEAPPDGAGIERLPAGASACFAPSSLCFPARRSPVSCVLPTYRPPAARLTSCSDAIQNRVGFCLPGGATAHARAGSSLITSGACGSLFACHSTSRADACTRRVELAFCQRARRFNQCCLPSLDQNQTRHISDLSALTLPTGVAMLTFTGGRQEARRKYP